MAGPTEILVGGGVAAVLAAAIGGGLKAFGVEIPLAASTPRQLLLLFAGLTMVAAGVWLSTRPASVPSPPTPKAAVTGATLVDFRSSSPEDSLTPGRNQGYLLVTTNVAVRNTSEPARNMIWTNTTGTLTIGGATIPYRSHYFTSLDDTGRPWMGEGAVTARPEAIAAGEVIQHDVMFIPANTGTGRYSWDDFLRAIGREGEPNPVFELAVATAIGEAEGPSLILRCRARLDQLMADIRRAAAEGSRSYWITAECGN
jgi:hypothetical protein